MSSGHLIKAPKSRFQRISNGLLAGCLGVMAVAHKKAGSGSSAVE